MTIAQKIFLGLTILFLTSSCQEDNCPSFEATPSTIEILPIGDSRVEGARPLYESYRYELWKRLVENGWDIDFIGSRTDEAEYPNVQERCFDNEHEGTGGATTIDNLAVLENTIFEKVPEVVLLGIGGNDISDAGRSAEETLTTLKSVIGKLQEINPNVSIFLEQIAPGRSDFMTPALTQLFLDFNAGIPGVASDMATATSSIFVVDNTPGWTDAFMADEVHYNEAGAKRVADNYYAAMDANIQR